MLKMILKSYLWTLILISALPHAIRGTLDLAQDSRCLGCIRNTSSLLGIDTTKRCEGYYCGHYQISYTYWAEAGKPGNNHGARDYEKCVRDKSCAEQTVRAYFKKFKRDCNNDGLIDCLDMAALHKGGPTSCSSDWFFKSRFWLAFNKTSCVNDRYNLIEQKSEFEESLRQPIALIKNQTLTSECLDCICDAVSGCNTSVNNCGTGTVCGPFAISQAYWKDGRRPGASWTACARTKECSSVTVKNYMEKYKRDCNDDGFITCEDYAAIHRRGARSCSNKDLLKDHYWNKFLACRASQRPLKDVNMVKVHEGSDESIISSSGLASRGDQNQQISSSMPFSLAVPSSSTPLASFEHVNPISDNHHPGKPAGSSLASSTVNSFQTTPSSRYEYAPPTLPIFQDNTNRPSNNKPARQTVDDRRHHHTSSTSAFSEVSKRKNEQALEKKPDQDYQPFTLSSSVYEISSIGGKITEYEGLHIQSSTETTSATTSTPITSTIATTISTSAPRLLPTIITTLANTQYTSTEVPSFFDSNLDKRQQVFTESQTTIYPVDQTHSSNVPTDENDYPSTELFPSQNNGNDKIISFDKVISGIVESPEFTNSYQPFPDLGTQNINEGKSNFQQKVQNIRRSSTTTNPRSSNLPAQKSTSKTQIIGALGRMPTKSNQIQANSEFTPPVEANSSSDQHSTTSILQNQPVEKITDSHSVLLPISGVDSVNMSSLFERGLNESSRIASECLECICDASSNCDSTVQCISKQREKNRCGLYMISWNQYQESDISLTSIALDPTGINEESADEKMYYDCTTDKVCAEKLIHLYIEKHQKDCNSDGRIDCYDIAAIHRVGPDNCNSGKFLSSQYWKDFNICYTSDKLATTVQSQASSAQLLFS